MSLLSSLKPKPEAAHDLTKIRWCVGWRDEDNTFFAEPEEGQTVAQVLAQLSYFLDEAATDRAYSFSFFVCRGKDADAVGGKD